MVQQHLWMTSSCILPVAAILYLLLPKILHKLVRAGVPTLLVHKPERWVQTLNPGPGAFLVIDCKCRFSIGIKKSHSQPSSLSRDCHVSARAHTFGFMIAPLSTR